MDKNAVELNIASRNITGLAINAQGLNVQEYDGKIYRYDMKTGSSVTTIEAARSFMMKADTDDAGHLVTARDNNTYGAGFMVYYYDETKKRTHIVAGLYSRGWLSG